jgi:hypothetical protein
VFALGVTLLVKYSMNTFQMLSYFILSMFRCSKIVVMDFRVSCVYVFCFLKFAY